MSTHASRAADVVVSRPQRWFSLCLLCLALLLLCVPGAAAQLEVVAHAC